MNSLTIFRRAKAGFSAPTPSLPHSASLPPEPSYSVGKGLVGDHFISLALVLSIKKTDERQETLGNIEKAIADIEKAQRP